MALTGGAIVGQQGLGSTVKMMNRSRIKLAADNSYPSGGYTSFSTFVKTILGTKITIIDIYQTDIGSAGGYLAAWDRSADTLMFYGTGAAEKGAMTQLDAATNLSALTAVELMVEWC